jgi:hypothetical protein
MSTAKIVMGSFFSICLLLSLLTVMRPKMLTRLNLAYFRWTFKLMGYEIELKPTSPNKPEKIARVWAILMCLAFTACLIAVIFSQP